MSNYFYCRVRLERLLCDAEHAVLAITKFLVDLCRWTVQWIAMLVTAWLLTAVTMYICTSTYYVFMMQFLSASFT